MLNISPTLKYSFLAVYVIPLRLYINQVYTDDLQRSMRASTADNVREAYLGLGVFAINQKFQQVIQLQNCSSKDLLCHIDGPDARTGPKIQYPRILIIRNKPCAV